MKTSWKSLGRSLFLLAQSNDGQQSLRGGESIEDGGWSGSPKDATADENVKVVCKTCEAKLVRWTLVYGQFDQS